jgi:A/G-specific adenine glycosylase
LDASLSLIIAHHSHFRLNPTPPLISWYQAQGRDLPWRQTRDPYAIWLSEIILQQTRVAQGLGYYQRFLERFPTVGQLANAHPDEVRKLWEGLGYYSRARNLHATAKEVAHNLGGQFPPTWQELIRLKGIGPYTARAIASFAFGQQVAVLDGNVFRVVSRFLGDSSPIDLPATREAFQQILDGWVKGHDAPSFNHAIMDLGATVCLPRNPLCGECPLARGCKAHQAGDPHAFPQKAKKLKRSVRHHQFYLLSDQQGRIAIRQRPDKGLWAGLYEIPNEEMKPTAWKKAPKGLKLALELTHVFTHFDMHIRVFRGPIEALPQENCQFINPSEIPIFAFSRAVLRIFEGVLDKVD